MTPHGIGLAACDLGRDQPDVKARLEPVSLFGVDARRLTSGQNRWVRMTYDWVANAFYLHLTDEHLPPGRDSVPVDPPEGCRPSSLWIGETEGSSGWRSLIPGSVCTPTYSLRRKSSPKRHS